MNRLFASIFICAILFVIGKTNTHAQTAPSAPPSYVLSADSVTYDETGQQIFATGHVEVADQDRILLADRVVYSLIDGSVTAEGNVSLLEPSGDVLFANKMTLGEGLRSGVIDSLSMLTAENARFAANGAVRDAEGRTTLSRAVFSPCNLCPKDKERPPLWQIRAARVVHDSKGKFVRYEDAVLEFFGLPVAYTPFFQHVDPTVKRKTGFLAPEYGSSSNLGFSLEIPYYFNLAPNRDLTVAPIFTSKEGVVLTSEYRAQTSHGRYQFQGSATYPRRRNDNNEQLSGRRFRGHILGTGEFEIARHWDWGFRAHRSSDDTYLRRYRFDDANNLTSNLFVEGIKGANYAKLSGYAFQGLRATDDPDTTPLVLPLLDYRYEYPRSLFGGNIQLDANMAALHRKDGTDSRRLTLAGRWQKRAVTDFGLVTESTAELRGDLFHVSEFDDPNDNRAGAVNGFDSRLRPSLAVDLRYPFINNTALPWGVTTTLEPIVQVIASPNGGNKIAAPNEDSLSLEFDESNLFSNDRYPGYDRVEGGSRVNFGFQSTAYYDNGGEASLLAGQVYRISDRNIFDDRTGLNGEFSDYVAAVRLAPSKFLDLTGRVRVDRKSLDLQRTELYTRFGPEFSRFSANYVRLGADPFDPSIGSREELFISNRTRLSEHWFINGSTRQDLTGSGSQIRSALGLEYADECIIFDLRFERDFTRDREVEPSTSVKLRVVLKHLTE